MGRDPPKETTPDLFSTNTVRATSSSPTKLAGDAASQRHVLPKNLPHAVKHLSDGELGQLLEAAFHEAKRRGRSPWTVGTDSILSSRRLPDLLTKRSSATDKSKRRQVDVADVTLTRGQMNAVRSAFKAGITPLRICATVRLISIERAEGVGVG